MHCEQATALISAQIDNEIAAEDRALLDQHLRLCPACRATLEAFCLQDHDLQETFEPRRQAVQAMVEQVNASLHTVPRTQAPRPPSRWPPILVFAAAAAMFAIGLPLLWMLHQASAPPQTRSPKDDPTKEVAESTVPDRLTPRPREKPPNIDSLQVGAEVTTKSGERRRLGLPDGSVLFVNQQTSLHIDSDRQATLSRGSVFLEVAAKPASGKATFVVKTPDREVKALGTRFGVQADKDGTEVLVTQGKVEVSGVDAPLEAGQLLSPGGAQATPAPRSSHLLDWTRDLVAAAESPLVPASQYGGGALITVDSSGQEAHLSLRKFHVDVHIEDGFARTTIDQTYFNHHPWRLEGTFYFPLPPDASLSRLAMYVDGKLMEGGMAERDYARAVYEKIVRTQRDPALLEWVDGSTFKMRVFPLEGRQEKRIILSYSQRLSTLYGRTTYRFPAGHNLQVVRDWSFQARVNNAAGWEVSSPSHPSMKILPQKNDLVLTDSARAVKVDQDVVLELNNPADVDRSGEMVRFARAEHENASYLMLRFRPDLPGNMIPQRRDWVFLFESSADRDPLLARTQIEIIRTLVNQIGHDDTFNIVTASTTNHRWARKRQPATRDNIQDALDWLDRTHLIGALDLDKALREAEAVLAGADNPHLVHLGSGITAMGMPQGELARTISENIRYVGVGVGKRWGRDLMKQAAERTGGYYTQINPDESVGWRTFELLSTLNTPRLLGVTVEAKMPGGLPDQPRILVDNPSVAQGEEVCAITRLPLAAPLPEAMIFKGFVDGKPFQREIAVRDVAGKADYLPRTWAKLEIDRLLADHTDQKNKDRIIELSKAMYVMTPYTSLLVLENEAMYQEFKVDRGRKDHWALYACPAKIDVIYEPDPSQCIDVRNAPKDAKPNVQQVMQTVLMRRPPAFFSRITHEPEGWLPQFDPITGQPVSLSLEDAIATSLDRPNNTEFWTENTWDVTGYSVNGQLGNWTQRVNNEKLLERLKVLISSQERVRSQSEQGRKTRQELTAEQNELRLDDRVYLWDIEHHGQMNGSVGLEARDYYGYTGRAVRANLHREGATYFYLLGSGISTSTPVPPWVTERMEEKYVHKNHYRTPIMPARRGWPLVDINGDGFPDAHDRGAMGLDSRSMVGKPKGWWPQFDPITGQPVNQLNMGDGLNMYLPGADYNNLGFYLPANGLVVRATSRIHSRIHSPLFSTYIQLPSSTSAVPLVKWQEMNEAVDNRGWPREITGLEGIRDFYGYTGRNARVDPQLHSLAFSPDGRRLASYGPPILSKIPYLDRLQERTPTIRDLRFAESSDIVGIGRGLGEPLGLLIDDSASMTEFDGPIRWPEMAGEGLPGLLSPGDKREARQGLLYQGPVYSGDQRIFTDMLNYAPGLNSSSADIKAVIEAEAAPDLRASPGTIAPEARRLIDQARKAGWQTLILPTGVNAPEICMVLDGQGRYRYERTLPLGLREEVICDGATLLHLYPELGLAGRRTVSRFHRAEMASLLPSLLLPAEDLARGADLIAVDAHTVAVVPHLLKNAENAEETNPVSYRQHLVFGDDGRLAERQVVRMPGMKVLVREVYDGKGLRRMLDAEGKELLREQANLSPATAPNLKPDLGDLVVLSLPVRSRSHVMAALKLDSNYNLSDPLSGCYWALKGEEAMCLLASMTAEHSNEAALVLAECFQEHKQVRRGHFALLAAAGVDLDNNPAFREYLARRPDDPLIRYLALTFSPTYRYLQARWPLQFGKIVGSNDSLLGQLSRFSDLLLSCGQSRYFIVSRLVQPGQRKLAFDFIRRRPRSPLALALLCYVPHQGRMSKDEHLQVAGLWERLAGPGKEFTAVYEQARALLDAGKVKEARALLVELYERTLHRKTLPPIDADFFNALHDAGNPDDPWTRQMLKSAAYLIDNKSRSAVVVLAAQAHTLKDPTLSDNLLSLALTGIKDYEERAAAYQAAITFLTSIDREARALELVRELLEKENFDRNPHLWRLSSQLLTRANQNAEAIRCLEKALDLEYAQLPEVIDLETWRRDYRQLLDHYDKLAETAREAAVAVPELTRKVVRAADRWRAHDPAEGSAACDLAARILTRVGQRDLAWEYRTTPIAYQHGEGPRPAAMAAEYSRSGEYELADRAYVVALRANPNDGMLWWDRAWNLRRWGKIDESRVVLNRLAEDKENQWGDYKQRAVWLLQQ
jgi:tetratricopeptide (TPR) repeat protein